MRPLERYLKRIHKYETFDGKVHWSFYGDGDGDFEQISDVVPSEEFLKNYLKDLRTQASYVSELLKK